MLSAASPGDGAQGKVGTQLLQQRPNGTVLQEFETVIPDIQDAITTPVSDSISELIRQEIGHVLQGALSGLSDEAT